MCPAGSATLSHMIRADLRHPAKEEPPLARLARGDGVQPARVRLIRVAHLRVTLCSLKRIQRARYKLQVQAHVRVANCRLCTACPLQVARLVHDRLHGSSITGCTARPRRAHKRLPRRRAPPTSAASARHKLQVTSYKRQETTYMLSLIHI